MHGCWSGRGSSSSRSTLDRASSRVTWVVMAAVSVFHTEGKGGNEEFQGPPNTSLNLTSSDSLQRTREVTCTKTTLSISSQGALNLQLIFEDPFMVYKHFYGITFLCDQHGIISTELMQKQGSEKLCDTHTTTVTKGKGLQITPDARTQATASPHRLFF